MCPSALKIRDQYGLYYIGEIKNYVRALQVIVKEKELGEFFYGNLKFSPKKIKNWLGCDL